MKITLLVDEAISCEDCYDSELLQKLQEEGTAEYSLPEFAGGAPLLRNVLKQLASLPEESAVEEGERPLKLLDVTPASLGDFLEAAATLRSPRFLRLLVLGQELQSRQALPFLEQVVRLSGRSTDISEKMDEAFVKVANFFCSRLDYQDLRLGDALAQGSLKVSLEVLRCHRQDFPPGPPSPPRDGSRPGTATPSVAAGYSVQGEHRRATLEWSQHKFAATVFQRHLRLEAEAAKAAGCARVAPFLRQPDALVLGMESEEEAEAVPAEHLEDNVSEIANLVSMDVVEDLEEELVDSVPDDRIKRLAALAEFLDAAATPPITAAAVVRSSLGHQDAAVLFRDFFCTSKKLRWMVVTGEVPSEFLHEVAWHPAASLALRRMLARHETLRKMGGGDETSPRRTWFSGSGGFDVPNWGEWPLALGMFLLFRFLTQIQELSTRFEAKICKDATSR